MLCSGISKNSPAGGVSFWIHPVNTFTQTCTHTHTHTHTHTPQIHIHTHQQDPPHGSGMSKNSPAGAASFWIHRANTYTHTCTNTVHHQSLSLPINRIHHDGSGMSKNSPAGAVSSWIHPAKIHNVHVQSQIIINSYAYPSTGSNTMALGWIKFSCWSSLCMDPSSKHTHTHTHTHTCTKTYHCQSLTIPINRIHHDDFGMHEVLLQEQSPYGSLK